MINVTPWLVGHIVLSLEYNNMSGHNMGTCTQIKLD